MSGRISFATAVAIVNYALLSLEFSVGGNVYQYSGLLETHRWVAIIDVTWERPLDVLKILDEEVCEKHRELYEQEDSMGKFARDQTRRVRRLQECAAESPALVRFNEARIIIFSKVSSV